MTRVLLTERAHRIQKIPSRTCDLKWLCIFFSLLRRDTTPGFYVAELARQPGYGKYGRGKWISCRSVVSGLPERRRSASNRNLGTISRQNASAANSSPGSFYQHCAIDATLVRNNTGIQEALLCIYVRIICLIFVSEHAAYRLFVLYYRYCFSVMQVRFRHPVLHNAGCVLGTHKKRPSQDHAHPQIVGHWEYFL